MEAALTSAAPDGEVEVGERVTLLDLVTARASDYLIVGSRPEETAGEELSIDSPLGRALLGRHVGDVVTIDTVACVARFEVVQIDG